jgi:GTP pyrophosphokinase
MHNIAERGIAAHWIYKEGTRASQEFEVSGEQLAWLKDLVESGQAVSDPHEFMSSVKGDLFQQHVYVFSPKGDVIALAAGSTPIDFAYHIHSEVGNHCTGARVNGQQVALGHRLRNGDTVEIVTSPAQTPSRDWLTIVATTKAKQRIRGWLKQEERNRSISIARELLVKDLKKVKLHLDKVMKDGSLERIAQEFGLKDVNMLFAEVGYGKISTAQIVSKLLPEDEDIETKLQQERSTIQQIFQRAAKSSREKSGIRVNGMDDVVFRFAHCCEPLPGDELIGYITRGRGVAIHTVGCPETLSLDPLRIIPVSWEENAKTQRTVGINVQCIDRIGILAALTQAIASTGANIVSAQINTSPDGRAVNAFEVKVESSKQLEGIQRALTKIKGVLKVERSRRGAE